MSPCGERHARPTAADGGVSDPQIDASIYRSRAYLTKERICSFWYQVDEVLALEPADVLEVGPGPGMATRWLREAGVGVSTLDFDEDVEPDVVGSVTKIPLADDSVDAALCAQVLEHLPWDDASLAMRELARVARRGVVLTVPDISPFAGAATPLYWAPYIDRVRRTTPQTRVGLAVALIRRRIRLRDWLFTRFVPAHWGLGGGAVTLPRWTIPHVPWHHEFDGQHYWEVGTTDVSLDDVLDLCRTAGLNPTRVYRIPENPYHHLVVARH
jgi:SAM-dependent methyltransferase